MMNKIIKRNEVKPKVITIPNIMSFFRLALIPLIVWLYTVRQNYMLTSFMLLLSGATDIADGFIARKFNMTSDLGKVLDPVADKLTQAAMLFCLSARFPLMIAPIAMMLIKELCMGVSGILIIKKSGKVFGANWHGKLATFLLDGMMLLHVIWYDIPAYISDITIAACIIMMSISFIIYGKRNLTVLRENKENNTEGQG